jgi:hypothetical protein
LNPAVFVRLTGQTGVRPQGVEDGETPVEPNDVATPTEKFSKAIRALASGAIKPGKLIDAPR